MVLLKQIHCAVHGTLIFCSLSSLVALNHVMTTFIHHLKKKTFYLFIITFIERERERMCHLLARFPNICNSWDCSGQVAARCLEPNLSVPCRRQGSKHLSQLPPRVHIRRGWIGSTAGTGTGHSCMDVGIPRGHLTAEPSAHPTHHFLPLNKGKDFFM